MKDGALWVKHISIYAVSLDQYASPFAIHSNRMIPFAMSPFGLTHFQVCFDGISLSQVVFGTV